MAAVSVSPLPRPAHQMSARRIPLANNPNAVNSPFRPNAQKRQRQDGRDADRNQSPPKKKLVIEHNSHGLRRPQPVPVDPVDGRVFESNVENVQPSTFERKLAAARDAKHSQQQRASEKQDKTSTSASANTGDLEHVRQWRKHYKRLFPEYVFYFESMPQDIANKALKQIISLGAREEKFFSKNVTHVVTTRPIPPTAADDAGPNTQATSTRHSSTSQTQPSTINPSLLDRFADGHHLHRSRQQAEILAAKQDGRRAQTSNDVLRKARDLGIKIWALEKFDRMMDTMFKMDLVEDDHRMAGLPRASKETDLSQLLKKEKQNAPIDRNPWQDIIPFRGCYIYVHDMDERHKPVMVRDYPRPVQKEDGEWPMFRSVSNGRCPFVDEPHPRRDELEKAKKASVNQKLPRTRAAAAAIGCQTAQDQTNGALKENEDAANRMPKPPPPVPTSKTFEPPKMKQTTSGNLDSMPLMLGSARASFRGIPGKPGGEPVASGLQKADRTSAIQSQMISSAPNMPGKRTGTTKEMHQLQRRVLDKNSGLSGNSIPSSYMNDVRAAINHDSGTAPRRTTRQNAGEGLDRIYEEDTQEDETEPREKTLPKNVRAPKKRQAARREPKPGYCENCREKYDDFDSHVKERKHRKFAISPEHWTELDSLLNQLTRPLKNSKA